MGTTVTLVTLMFLSTLMIVGVLTGVALATDAPHELFGWHVW